MGTRSVEILKCGAWDFMQPNPRRSTKLPPGPREAPGARRRRAAHAGRASLSSAGRARHGRTASNRAQSAAHLGLDVQSLHKRRTCVSSQIVLSYPGQLESPATRGATMRKHQIHTENSTRGFLARLAGADRWDRQRTFIGVSRDHAFAGLREQLVREDDRFRSSDRFIHVAD